MNKKSIATSLIALASMVGLIAIAGPASADALSYSSPAYAPYYDAYGGYGYDYGYDYTYGYGYESSCGYSYSYGCSYDEVIDIYNMPTFYTEHTFAPYTPVTYTIQAPVYYNQQTQYSQPSYYTQPSYYAQPQQSYYQQPYYGNYGSNMGQRVYGVPTGRTDFVGTQLCDYSSIGYYGAYDCNSDPRQPVQDVYTGRWY